MILAQNGNLSAIWQGECSLGNLFVIERDGKVIHSGCFGWIANRWKKLTGEKLAN